MTNLADKALLSHLSVSQWNPQKHDSRVSREVVRQAGARPDSGRFIKTLLKSNALANFGREVSNLRLMHYRLTLPWIDGGARILPYNLVEEHRAEFNEHKRVAFRHVQKFFEEYSSLQEKAKDELGDLYDPLDYPDKATIESKYRIRMHLLPIPREGDWRIKFEDEIGEQIKKSVEESMSLMLEKATSDVWERVFTVISHAYTRLADSDGKLFQSMIDHLDELADILPDLNLAEDPVLDKLSGDIRMHLGCLDIVDLRKDKNLRARAAKEAAEMLEEVKKHHAV